MPTTQKSSVSRIIHHRKLILGIGILVLLASLITACGKGEVTVKENQPKQTTVATGETAGGGISASEVPQALLDGKYDQLYEKFSDDFKKHISSTDFSTSAVGLMKGIESFKELSVLAINGGEQRTWVSQSGNKGLVVVFDAQGMILGLQAVDLEQWPETDQKLTNTVYDLPFKGDWLVIWGGTNVLVNYHYDHEAQRYAYDFVQYKEGSSFKGDPLKNESYYAFGQPALAPADGTVVSIVNDIPDNNPVGVMNEKVPAGNTVVIDHGGEYSTLAHLKKGSVSVNVGDKVSRGDQVGLIGNSGNSSEAHMHFQVSDGAELFQSRAINVNWSNGIKPVQGMIVKSE